MYVAYAVVSEKYTWMDEINVCTNHRENYATATSQLR